MDLNVVGILVEAEDELASARKEFPDFNSAHEGKAIIEEELDELWDEIKKKKRSRGKMRKEALHVVAMGLRFITDICEEKPHV